MTLVSTTSDLHRLIRSILASMTQLDLTDFHPLGFIFFLSASASSDLKGLESICIDCDLSGLPSISGTYTQNGELSLVLQTRFISEVDT